MGEIADDMINGRSCSWCGIYFKREHSFPVVCHDCFYDATEEEISTSCVRRATIKEL